jgi:hypothetical protein
VLPDYALSDWRCRRSVESIESSSAWDTGCNILTDTTIDPNSGRFHIAVKVGESTMLNSLSPVDASETICLTSDQLWEDCFISAANALSALLLDCGVIPADIYPLSFLLYRNERSSQEPFFSWPPRIRRGPPMRYVTEHSAREGSDL